MPPRRHQQPPKIQLHKASGQARVRLSGKDYYLGPFGSDEAQANYDREVAEWLRRGRIVTKPDGPAASMAELINAFFTAGVFAKSHNDELKQVLKIVVRLYGRMPVSAFGLVALEVVREKMVEAGWKRKMVNARVKMVQRMFRWGVGRRLVTHDQQAELAALESLKAGQTAAPESKATQPIALEHVEACTPFMVPMVAAMVRLQMRTGMRTKELTSMRTGDIDMSDESCWVYRPGSHKTAHLGKVRDVPIGPIGIDLLRPFLLTDPSQYIFSPARANAERLVARAASRKTPLSCGNRAGLKRVEAPKRRAGDRYDTPTYRKAVMYAIARAFPLPAELARHRREPAAAWQKRIGERWPEVRSHLAAVHWHPHQLRRAIGTLVANEFSLEHSQRVLGHSNIKATQIYSKLSLDKAKKVMRKIGYFGYCGLQYCRQSLHCAI